MRIYTNMISFFTNNLPGENVNCAYQITQENLPNSSGDRRSPTELVVGGVNAPLPKSSLGYNTNNQYKDFPGKMADGRALIASWQPEAVINNEIIRETGIKTNWEYRQFMTSNAKEIMTYNFTEACNDVGYYKRFVEPPKSQIDSSSPHIYQSINDNTPVMGVQTSDLKQMYLSREQLQSRKVSPVITQDQLLSVRG